MRRRFGVKVARPAWHDRLPARGPRMEAPVLRPRIARSQPGTISPVEFPRPGSKKAWEVCDRFDLQTEIWRRRILGSVRDREKRGGERRGTGFLQCCASARSSKTPGLWP